MNAEQSQKTDASQRPVIAAVPSIDYSMERWLEPFLKAILRAALIIGLILVVAAFLTNTETVLLILYSAAYVVLVITYFFPFQYNIRAGLFLFLLYLMGISGLLDSGVYGDSRIFLLVFIVMTAMLFGEKSIGYSITLVLLTGLTFGELIITGTLPLINTSMPAGQLFPWIMAFLGIILLALLLTTGLRMLLNEFLRAEESASTALRGLSEEHALLESRVTERTADLTKASESLQRRADQLGTIAELSRAISLVREPDILLPQVTRLISQRFGYYHVGIFLVDESREFAVLHASNSQGGQQMLQRSHKLLIGSTSIVGYVISTGRPRMASNVGEDTVYFDNPHLPDTHSEMALPLMVSERIIGALDVQSTYEYAFTQEDADVLHILADQVAVAIENSRLLSETRRSLNDVQAIYRESLQQQWGQVSGQVRGVRYTPQGVEVLVQPIDRPEVHAAAKEGKVVAIEEGEPALAVPLKLRDEVIGVLSIRPSGPTQQWTDDDITLVQAIAERASLALENARLLEDAQRRAAKERTIGEITAKISASVNLRNILQTAVEELGRAMPGSEIVVQFQSKE